MTSLLTSLTTLLTASFSTATAPAAVSRPRTTARPALPSHPAVTVFGLALLTLGVLLVHGWHPYADDAGIYDSGILHLLHPEAFRVDGPFVAAHARLSVFAHLLAWMAGLTRLRLPVLLLGTYLVSIALYLAACRAVASRLFRRPVEAWCATAMAAACFTLPVAGTALFLMDPYVTARSFSTPLSLFALAAVLDRLWGRAAGLLVLALLLHPLMGLYAVMFLAMVALAEIGFPRAAILLAGEYLTGALVLFLFSLRTHASEAYHQAVASRSYLLLSRWEPWEWLGLIVPALLLLLASRHPDVPKTARRLAGVAAVAAGAFTLAAILFLHPVGSMLLVRLQPLRGFHLLYAVGVLLAGGLLGQAGFDSIHTRRAQAMVWALIAVIASIFYLTQRSTVPFSAHIEWPAEPPQNAWQQAFAWIARNTPKDAVFASDPDLVLLPGEDAQSFRASTGRSLLADYKDEGVVVVFPELAGEWRQQYVAQEGIERMTDAEREARLRPFGVGWLLLPVRARTGLDCPFRNLVAQVCRLP